MPSLPYAGDGSEYDVVVGGVPFRLATASDMPQSIQTIDVNKEQFDTERDPGEQSLSSFWRRSQSSFHWGAGYLYDNRTDEDFAGFWSSSGVDPLSVPGEVRLLRDESSWSKPGYLTKVRCYQDTIRAFDADGLIYGPDSSYTLIQSSATHDILSIGYENLDIWLDADDEYVLTGDGLIYKIRRSDSVNEGYWDFTKSSPSFQMGYAKYRLWVYGNTYIMVLPLGGTPDNGTTPIEPIFESPQTGWTYTCMGEGPQAVYFGGHDGFSSSIQMFTIQSDGSLPSLSGAITAAILPQGELILAMDVLAGQYVGLATSAGFRVGQIQGDGTITYGPLLIDRRTATGEASSTFGGAVSVTSYEDSFYVSCKDTSIAPMIYRVDTAHPLDELVFPYCRDMEAGSSTGTDEYAHSLCALRTSSSSRPRLVALNNGAIWVNDTTLRDNGWIQTSRIRYNTSEPKAFKYANLTVADVPLDCWVRLDYLDQDDVETVGTVWSDIAAVRAGTVTLPTAPQSHISLKINLVQVGTNDTPVLSSFLVRALPASKPQRLITLPLLCFDEETTRSGQTYSTKGWARERLEALQAYEDVAATVTYTRGETSTELSCVIDSLQFVQTSPPNPINQEGAGGVLILKLRTVEP